MSSLIPRASRTSLLVTAMIAGGMSQAGLADENAPPAKATATSATQALVPAPATEPASQPRKHVIPDLQLELLWVEPGTFLMGSPNHQPERHKAEGPETRVILTDGFW